MKILVRLWHMHTGSAPQIYTHRHAATTEPRSRSKGISCVWGATTGPRDAAGSYNLQKSLSLSVSVHTDWLTDWGEEEGRILTDCIFDFSPSGLADITDELTVTKQTYHGHRTCKSCLRLPWNLICIMLEHEKQVSLTGHDTTWFFVDVQWNRIWMIAAWCLALRNINMFLYFKRPNFYSNVATAQELNKSRTIWCKQNWESEQTSHFFILVWVTTNKDPLRVMTGSYCVTLSQNCVVKINYCQRLWMKMKVNIFCDADFNHNHTPASSFTTPAVCHRQPTS